jgi:hypothetical protein
MYLGNLAPSTFFLYACFLCRSEEVTPVTTKAFPAARNDPMVKNRREIVMLHQTPASDNTFIIAIAILACIVIVFMAVAIFLLLRSENNRDTHRPVEGVPASPSQEMPAHGLSGIPSSEIVGASPPEEGRRSELQFPISSSNFLDTTIGFMGCFVINLLLWLWILQDDSTFILWNPLNLIPLCANFLLLIFSLIGLLSSRGRWVALGVILAIIVNVLWSFSS